MQALVRQLLVRAQPIKLSISPVGDAYPRSASDCDRRLAPVARFLVGKGSVQAFIVIGYAWMSSLDASVPMDSFFGIFLIQS